jgi:DNA repair exonuclease SbcCD ATPase subunit
MRAGEEYVPERDEEEEEDAQDVIHELEDDKTSAEEAEEEAEEEQAVVQVVVGEVMRRASVVETVRDMLARKPVHLDQLTTLTDHEVEALEFLQTIIEGRTRSGAFVYAEQRLEQLNHVLADLQPLMAVGLVDGLEDTLHEVIDGFDELRTKLELLEEAQEEVRHLEGTQEEGAEDDEDDDDDDDADANDADENVGGDAEPKGTLAEESAAALAGEQKETPEHLQDPKQPGLWGRLWKRGKKPEEGGGGGGA